MTCCNVLSRDDIILLILPGCPENSLEEGKGRSRRPVTADGDSAANSSGGSEKEFDFGCIMKVEPSTNTSLKVVVA